MIVTRAGLGNLPYTCPAIPASAYRERPPMIRLYDNRLSGNGYKPRLLLAHLGQARD